MSKIRNNSFQHRMLPLLYFLLALTVCAEQWLQGAFRVSTDVSAGENGFEDIARIARDKQLDFILFSDQLISKGEYGLPPFREVFKVWQSRNSIRTYGITRYLNALDQLQTKFPDLIIIPGADIAPLYFWTGSPFNDSLTAHQWSEQMTVFGRNDAEFYRGLPVIHNDRFGFRFLDSLPRLASLLGIFIGIFILKRSLLPYPDVQGETRFIVDRPRAISAIVISLFCLLSFLNLQPYVLSHGFDQYSNPGLTPYQNVVDYINKNQGFCFWSAPEAEMKQVINRVTFHTRPYINDVVECHNHNGFAALYGDNASAHRAGKQWDTMLNQYCSGTRTTPPVIVGEIDYHADRELDLILTVARVSERSRKSLISSIGNGKSYAIAGRYARQFRIESVSLNTSTHSASLGEFLVVDKNSALFSLSAHWENDSNRSKNLTGKLDLIVNGDLIGTTNLTGEKIDYQKRIVLSQQTVQYVRFNITYPGISVVGNPIFIRSRST